MRKELKGGAGQYNISEILGPRFVEFMKMITANGLNSFLVGDGANDIYPPTRTVKRDPKDIDYHFTEFIVAASAAFRDIENPDINRAQVSNQYSQNVSEIVNELVSGSMSSGMLPTPLTEFGFDQLPIDIDKFTELVRGFHFLPYDNKFYPNFNNDTNNGFINAVRYLYHFISLMDISSLKGRDVIEFLSGDNLRFMLYVKTLTQALLNDGYFQTSRSTGQFPTGSDDSIKQGVLRGLEAVAEQIINRLRAIDKSVKENAIPENNFDITGQDFADAAAIGTYLTKIGIPTGAEATAVQDALGSIKGMQQQGTNAAAAVMDSTRLLKYAIDSLMNPRYIADPSIAITINPAKLSTYQRGGVRKTVDPITGVPNTDIVSLEILYGPTLTADNGQVAGDRNLTNVEFQADKTDAELILPENIELLVKALESIEKIGTSTDGGVKDNSRRVVLLAILNYLLVKNQDLETIGADVTLKTELNIEIKKSLRGYAFVNNRLRKMPTNFNSNSDGRELVDVFVGEFTRGTYQSFDIDNTGTGNLISRGLNPSSPPPTKNNLATNKNVADFYRNIVLKNIQFYNDYFNLIKGANTPVSLNAAENITNPTQLADYRLNVKKNSAGYARFTGGQHGGAGIPGDTIFIDRLPDLDFSGSITGWWLNTNDRLSIQDIIDRALSPDAIRDLARMVYLAPSTQPTITFGGKTINISDVAGRAAIARRFALNYSTSFNDILKNALKNQPGGPIAPNWKREEQKFSEYLLRQASKWRREGDSYVLYNDNGTIADKQPMPDDNCIFINESKDQCLNVLSSCLNDNSNTLSSSQCKNLINMDFRFEVAPGTQSLQESVMKINPIVAFKILQQFRFGSQLVEETRDPFRGFKRYKVQSVGSWLRELFSDEARNCNLPTAPVGNPCDPQPLSVQLGNEASELIRGYAKDPQKANFFNYLDMLVQWVNANPQVLNREESKRSNSFTGDYPKPSKAFNMYAYRNPYARVDIKLKDTSCGLERLKSSILNQLTGSDASGMISNITSVPLGIEMPLNRQAFINPVQLGPNFGMIGGSGSIYDTQYQVQNMYGESGYDMFSQIYQDLINTMNGLSNQTQNVVSGQNVQTVQNSPPKMRLSSKTNTEIQKLLETFKNSESSLRDGLVNLVKRNKLYQASRGYVDPFNQNNEEFESILKKHSNLLKLSHSYNKKAINLIDVYQTITKTILEKLDETSRKNGTNIYERPLNPQYHLQGGDNNTNHNDISNWNSLANRNAMANSNANNSYDSYDSNNKSANSRRFNTDNMNNNTMRNNTMNNNTMNNNTMNNNTNANNYNTMAMNDNYRSTMDQNNRANSKSYNSDTSDWNTNNY